ncbi:M23 family metallopeptidase [Roseomonas sp. HJA6]|uniref:M23 family metallopeptidase n=1 Tax=Roseomonas alba TaxID=2846776 RepID=A0ABS7A4Y7_9PROT|nr:M23 family metallopeptidase [Neoroseomonas alba]MBW6397353.1 M23 family metallopeptidase [Neoroseomonas alba]
MRKTRPQTRLTRSIAFAAGLGAACSAVLAITPSAAFAGACDTLLPVAGEYSSGFGYRGRGFHPGVDIRAPYGAPIQAARPGRVVYAGRYFAYGLIVDVEHADGTVARYAHLSRIAPGVAVGAQVGPNGAIGAVGRTGRTTGAHLHVELRIHGRPVNPWPWLTQTACLEDRQVAEAPR